MAVYDEIVRIYQKHEENKSKVYTREGNLNQKDHVLQSAYVAYSCGAPETITIMLLFHDIGQMLDSTNLKQEKDFAKLDMMHAEKGARWLIDQGFPQEYVNYVKYHDVIKVILATDDARYFNSLSEDSQKSMKIQGQDTNKINEFNIVFADKLVRRISKCFRMCDELGKVPNWKVPGFEFYQDMMKRVLNGQGKEAFPGWMDRIEELNQLRIKNNEKYIKHTKSFENIIRFSERVNKKMKYESMK